MKHEKCYTLTNFVGNIQENKYSVYVLQPVNVNFLTKPTSSVVITEYCIQIIEIQESGIEKRLDAFISFMDFYVYTCATCKGG